MAAGRPDDAIHGAATKLSAGDVDEHPENLGRWLRWNSGIRAARRRSHGVHMGEVVALPPTRRSIEMNTCEADEFHRRIESGTWTHVDPGQICRGFQASDDGPVK
jgi:hypothetical protein